MPEAVTPAAAPAAAPSTTPAANAAPAAKTPSAAPAGTPQAPPEPKPAAEKLLIKVNGKLRELSRDEAVRELQKGFASRENFEKGASLTRKNQALLKALQVEDPDEQESALRALGVDPDKLAERRLQRRAQEAQMTPEQKRIAELENEIQRTQKAAKDAEAKRQSDTEAAQEKQYWAQIEADYTSEIDRAQKAGELKGFKPAEVLFHMANEAELNEEYGIQLSPAELVQEAKAKILASKVDFNERAKGLEGEDLLNEFDPEVLNKVLKAAVTRFKGGGQAVQPLEKPAQIGDPEKKPEQPKWIRPSDLRPVFL